MLLVIQLTTFLSLTSFALAACNQASIKLETNEELPNITDVRYTHTARVNGASNGLDANGLVGSRVYGNLSPFENITAFCNNEYSGTRNASTTLGGRYGADSRNGRWRGAWKWSTRNGVWNMNLIDRALQVNVSQSLEVGLDGSVTFELNARDLKCEQQGSGQWICKAGSVCDK